MWKIPQRTNLEYSFLKRQKKFTPGTPKCGTKERKAHKDSTSINEIDNPKEEIIASEFFNRIPW